MNTGTFTLMGWMKIGPVTLVGGIFIPRGPPTLGGIFIPRTLIPKILGAGLGMACLGWVNFGTNTTLAEALGATATAPSMVVAAKIRRRLRDMGLSIGLMRE